MLAVLVAVVGCNLVCAIRVRADVRHQTRGHPRASQALCASSAHFAVSRHSLHVL